mmetsp:Transcript_15954/g.45694  ORF Transcript_15954/g.45694 Transcript_15954/m.45694 type:complete len:300 (-) Transcript_15954:408-1307(-)
MIPMMPSSPAYATDCWDSGERFEGAPASTAQRLPSSAPRKVIMESGRPDLSWGSIASAPMRSPRTDESSNAKAMPNGLVVKVMSWMVYAHMVLIESLGVYSNLASQTLTTLSCPQVTNIRRSAALSPSLSLSLSPSPSLSAFVALAGAGNHLAAVRVRASAGKYCFTRILSPGEFPSVRSTIDTQPSLYPTKRRSWGACGSQSTVQGMLPSTWSGGSSATGATRHVRTPSFDGLLLGRSGMSHTQTLPSPKTAARSPSRPSAARGLGHQQTDHVTPPSCSTFTKGSTLASLPIPLTFQI